jgi:hypothetical protein
MPLPLQRQQEKENWWIIDADPRSLKPSNTFWACEISFFHSHKPLPTLRVSKSPFLSSKQFEQINGALKTYRAFL